MQYFQCQEKQNGDYKMDLTQRMGVLPVTTLFLKNFCFSLRTSYKDWCNPPTTQMFIFILFESLVVSFGSAFSLWVSLGKHGTRFFLVQCCPEPQVAKCCPRSIKTTLHRVFSCALLSGASRTTLIRVFTSVMLFQEYLDNITQDFFLCNIVLSIKSIKKTLNRFFSCAQLSRASRTTWHRIFTCVILSQKC